MFSIHARPRFTYQLCGLFRLYINKFDIGDRFTLGEIKNQWAISSYNVSYLPLSLQCLNQVNKKITYL